ncbi:hypothetical protein KR018_002093, partial [Drosophila ironensis]
MRVLNTELRLRFKNRKPRPFNRAASADDAVAMGNGNGMESDPSSPISPCASGGPHMRTYA